MYNLSYSSPQTGEQKKNYSKFFYLRHAVSIVAILALVVEAITDYFSLYRAMSGFTTKYGFAEWIPSVVAIMLVLSMTMAFYALGIFIVRSFFEGDFKLKEKNYFPYFAVLAFCLVYTSIFTLSTEGAQMAASEYFSEKPQVKDTERYLNTGTGDIEAQKQKDIEAIEKRYNGSISATEKAGKKALETQRKRHWEKSKTERMEADLANKLANLEQEKAREIREVSELRNGQIKTKTDISAREHGSTVAENERNIREAGERNAKNKKGGYYIAFFCLPLSTVCLALKAWMDSLCGIRLEVTISKSDFSQNPFGALIFAIKDGISGRMSNAAVKLHQRLAPRERLTFQDKDKSDEGAEWGSKGHVGFNRQGMRSPMALGNLDFEEDFAEKKN